MSNSQPQGLENQTPEEEAPSYDPVEYALQMMGKEPEESPDTQSFEEWPDPEELDTTTKSMAFNLDMLPNSFKNYVGDQAYRMSCPPDYIAISLMSSFGAVIGAKLAMQPKAHDYTWYEYPNIWSLGIGYAGEMKSPAMKAGYIGIEHLQNIAFKKYDEDDEKYRDEAGKFRLKKSAIESKIKSLFKDGKDVEALQAKEELDKSAPKINHVKRYIINDITAERLVTLQENNTNGLMLIRDEMAAIFKQFNKQGHETFRPLIVSAYDGKDSHTVDRQTDQRPVRCLRNMLTISGSIQPNVLSAFLNDADAIKYGEDGMSQRLQLTAFPDYQEDYKHVDKVPDSKHAQGIIDIFEKFNEVEKLDGFSLIQGRRENKVNALKFDDEAQKIYDEYHTKLMNRIRNKNDLSNSMISHLSKFRKLVPVLAMIINMVDFGLEAVKKSSLEKALMWAEYCESHANKMYSMQNNTNDLVIEDIANILLSKEIDSGFTARQLYKKHKKLPQGKQTNNALKMLCDMKWIVQNEEKTGGNTLVKFNINPRIYKYV